MHHREHSRLRCARRELTSCIRTCAEEYIRKRKHSQHPHEREGKKETSYCAASYGSQQSYKPIFIRGVASYGGSQQTYSLFSSEVCVPLGREGRRGRKRRTAACTVYVTSSRLSPDRKQYDRREQPQRGPVDPPANRITEAVFCELPRHWHKRRQEGHRIHDASSDGLFRVRLHPAVLNTYVHGLNKTT